MTKAPNKSLDALATMGFAIFHCLRDEMTYSVKLYGEALHGLRNALVDRDAVWKFDTLAAVTALCMYEVHFPPKPMIEVRLTESLVFTAGRQQAWAWVGPAC